MKIHLVILITLLFLNGCATDRPLSQTPNPVSSISIIPPTTVSPQPVYTQPAS